MDRIDNHVEVPRVDYQKLNDSRLGEALEVIRCMVEAARERQRGLGEVEKRESRLEVENQEPGRRASKFDALSIVCNADMKVGEIRQFCKFDPAGLGRSAPHLTAGRI